MDQYTDRDEKQLIERRPLTHQDELETRSDDLLYRLEDQYKNRIAGCRYEDDRRRVEIELCYIQREIGIRKHRIEFADALRARNEAQANVSDAAVG